VVSPQNGFFNHAFIMGKSDESPFAMITPYAACSYTAKGKFRIGELHHGIINAPAAKRKLIEYLILDLLIICKKVTTERFGHCF
jgi:hypothetical protein